MAIIPVNTRTTSKIKFNSIMPNAINLGLVFSHFLSNIIQAKETIANTAVTIATYGMADRIFGLILERFSPMLEIKSIALLLNKFLKLSEANKIPKLKITAIKRKM